MGYLDKEQHCDVSLLVDRAHDDSDISCFLECFRFHYMAISDDRQRIMPMPQDRDTGLPLAYKEAVLLTDPINPDLRGEVC